ncbi:hypothetical protein LTR62_005090 [Meristemomyces frigidus]|uniref:Peptidase S8/S53 domain-containing protein n=1 Tax=Meristemomyces frigidus TaxID=1508187 RepID=A0AAN7TNC8_9PEZI|nr:hypothetical protein LTR62_005090 [Meristemomyces frigidus]
MNGLILACVLSTITALAAPIQHHQSGGIEHIVIIDSNHPSPPQVIEVLQRLALHSNHSDVHHIYNNSAFQGFAASMRSHCLDLLANMSDVSLVEKTTSVSRERTETRQTSLTYQTRPNAPWGLQRISSTASISGNAKTMDYTYSYANPSLGLGTDIYILDTGLFTTHSVFGSRAKTLWSFDGNTTDLDGHGTHVAGTAAGAVLGVASNANILGIKALSTDGGGWSSNVIAGIDQVIQTHDARKFDPSTPFTGSVLSMSLASSSPVTAINAAITAAVAAGIHVVVAAGNAATDACSSSPASSGGTAGPAIAVGSISPTGSRSTFSNYGPCVDLYAPGEDVISAWPGAGGMLVRVLSGTSMATPHVTGIVAYGMSNATLAGDPGMMKEWVLSVGSRGGGDGQGGEMIMAGNGVLAGAGGEGILGFEKGEGGVGFRMVGG